MNESKKRTLFVTVLFFLTLICLLVTFFLQMDMQNTLAHIAAVRVTQTQTTDTLTASAVQSTSETVTEPESDLSESVRAVTAERMPTATPVQTTAASAVSAKTTSAEKPKQLSEQLVVNTNTKKIHSPDCAYAKNIKPENRADISAQDLQGYLERGYALCGHCEGCAK